MKTFRYITAIVLLMTVGVGTAWGATIDITQAEVTSNGSGKTSYSTSYNIDGWTGKYLVAYVKNPATYSLQLGYNTSSSAGAYNSHLTTPVMTGGATSVTIATKSHNGTNTASGRKFYLCKSGDVGYVNDSHLPAAGTYGSGAISSNNGSVTITISGSPTQFHIYPNGTAYISSITVTYSSGYTITYNANGGSGSMDNTTGASVSAASNGFTAPTGTVFSGWNTKADGNGTAYAAGASVNATVTLYAQWVSDWELTYGVSGSSWGDPAAMTVTDGVASCSVSLSAMTKYEFKFHKKSTNTYYGNSGGVIITDISDWGFGTDGSNCRLFSGPSGSYTFSWDVSASQGDVTYPSVSHPATGYAYFRKQGSDTYIKVYTHHNSSPCEVSNWDGSVQVNNKTEICGADYFYFALTDAGGCSKAIIRYNNNGSQTGDFTITSGAYSSKWGSVDDTNWHTFEKYSITFAGNGNDDGTMTNVSNICPESDQSLAANAYTKNHYTFAGWKTNAALTYVAYGDADDGTHEVAVAVNGIVPDRAKIKGIGSNITLTAQWNAIPQISFSVPAGVSSIATQDCTDALPEPEEIDDCWAFAGWTESSSHSGSSAPATLYAAGQTITPGSDITLYAVYKKDEFKLVQDNDSIKANGYYILTSLVEISSENHEFALGNEAYNTNHITTEDLTDPTDYTQSRLGAFWLYNPPTSVIWKSTGTASGTKLYNESVLKYLDLSSSSNPMLKGSTDNTVTFAAYDMGAEYIKTFNIADKTATTNYLSIGSTEADIDTDDRSTSNYSAYVYKRQSIIYATNPSGLSYTVTWNTNGSTSSETVTACAGVLDDLPTAPDDDLLEESNDGCIPDDKGKFMGWSSENIGSYDGTACPEDLFDDVDGSPYINADRTFYAIYAEAGTATGGTFSDAVTTQTGWTGSGVSSYSGNGVNFNDQDDYIQSPDISSQSMTSVVITFKAGYNKDSGSKVQGSILTFTSLDASNNEIASDTFEPSEAYNNQSTTYTIILNGSTVIKSVRVTLSTRECNVGMKYCLVSPYKNFRTSCCTTYDIVYGVDGSGDDEPTGPDKACEDQEVEFTPAPSTGYSYAGATVYDAGDNVIATLDANTTTFEMPGKDVYVVATYSANSYDVTLKPNGGSGSDQVVTATYDDDMPLTVKTAGTAIVVPTRTGYTFGGYYDTDASTGGKQYYSYSGTPLVLGSATTWDVANEADLYARWTAITTEITLDKNGGDTEGGALIDYDDEKAVIVTAAARSHYHLDGGYYTSGGVQILNANGSFAAENITGYVTSGKWSYTSTTLTLYAHWEIDSHTLTWNMNGGKVTTAGTGAAVDAEGEQSTTVNYGVTFTTPIVAWTGHTFGGWHNGTEIVTPASSMGDNNLTYTAQWTVNHHNLTVTDVDHVTITATPAGESAIGEGDDPADINYGTSITLAYSSLESKNYWGGWKVTDDSDNDVTNDVVAGNTLTMPDYNITVSAITYGDLIAWCDPQVTVSDGFCLTSYYVSGAASTTNSVYTTSAAGNLLTINSTDLGSVDKIEFSYLDGSDNTVTLTSSPFRLCNDGSSNYNVADGGAGSSYTKTGLSNTCDLSYSIRYKPTAYNLMDNYKLKMVFKKGTEVRKTIIREMNGRSLPEEFVIAAKFNGQWYALPNTLKGTQAEQGAITPIKITVDNTTTPTAATYAPTTTVYKGRAKYETSNPSSMALTSTGSNYLQTSNSVNQMWLSSSGYTGAVDWYFKSSDRSVYELAMDPVNTPTKKMGIDGGNMGYYGTPTVSAIYLLPITNKYTDIPATATEWGRYSVILAANPGATATKAQARIEAGTPTGDQTISAINAAMGTAKNVKVPVGSIDLADLANNEGKLLYIDWYNSSSTLLGTSAVTIPRIIAANRNMKTDGEPLKNAWTDKEVHVLPGFTLTANTSDYATNPGTATIKELHIYPGATLNVSTGTLTATTLRMHNGWTRAGDKKYDVARVYIADDAALEKTTASMDYDIYDEGEGRHYYPLAVPFRTKVKDIDYADSYLAGFSAYSTTGSNGQYAIKTYDGAHRATSGEDPVNNWVLVPDTKDAADVYLEPGVGYIITAVPVKGEAIIRVPLTFDKGWTNDGEKATYDDVTKNVIAVTAYGGDAATAHTRHKGWNMLGVPFMSSYGAGTDMYSGGGAAALINGALVVNTSANENMQYQSTTIPYVSVPSHDFSEYVQTSIEDAKLLPGWSFFVQVNTSGDLTFAVGNQRPDEDNPIYAPQRTMDSTMTRIKTGVILSSADGETSDKFGLIISDRYTQDYEVGADLEKMFGNGYTLATYSLSQGTRLAFNALSTTDVAQVIPVGYRAPEAGQYTFAINPRYATEGLLRVELIDYQTGDLTDLLTSTYTFTTSRTQDDTRFAIHVTYTDPNSEMPTGEAPPIETGETLTRKFILNGQLYIQRGTVIYDATGKEVRL